MGNLRWKTDKEFAETWVRREYNLKGISYADYLKSAEWKSVKAWCAKRPEFQQCACCHSTDRLNLHHRNYRLINRGFPPGYLARDLVSLCSCCHEAVHALAKKDNISVHMATKIFYRQVKKELQKLTTPV